MFGTQEQGRKNSISGTAEWEFRLAHVVHKWPSVLHRAWIDFLYRYEENIKKCSTFFWHGVTMVFVLAFLTVHFRL